MATPILRRTIISFFPANNSSLMLKSHFSVSLYFSTETTKPPLDHLTVTKFLINNHDFSPDAAAQIASRTRLKTQQNADSILQFLKHAGFSNPQMEKFFKSSPKLLSAHLEATIKPKFEIFINLGFTPSEIVEIVSNQSRVLHYSAPRISSSVATLKTLLGSNAAAARFLKTPGLFLKDIDTTLLPNVEFLKSCGVSMAQIVKLMSHIPRFFLHKPEKMRRFVEKADEMGSDRKSGSFIEAVRVVSSMTSETWVVKMAAFRELGFSDDDVTRAFKNSPKVLTTSEEKMRRVAEVLVGSGKYDRTSIVGTPIVFLYSVEKRIRPRLRVLRGLEEKEMIGDWPSLATLVTLTDEGFFQRFVRPNLEHVGGFWNRVCGEG